LFPCRVNAVHVYRYQLSVVRCPLSSKTSPKRKQGFWRTTDNGQPTTYVAEAGIMGSARDLPGTQANRALRIDWRNASGPGTPLSVRKTLPPEITSRVADR